MQLNSICCIDCRPDIVASFRKLVPQVMDLRPGLHDYHFDLPSALQDTGFRPDAIIQHENLTRRVLVSGLDIYDCPKLYWGLDPHLNAHWQSAYARLFDMTCSTQKRCITALKSRGAADVRWLPWFAPEGRWLPWSKRNHKIAFVGRITPQRPARKWMVALLENKFRAATPAIRDGLPYPEMLSLYRDSMLAPNETIFHETNLRLFEAASCGCLVLNPDTGEEMEGLFVPGKEVELFDTITDLQALLTRHLANTRTAQAMGRAAFERTQAEHLITHRVEQLHAYIQDTGSHAAKGKDNEKWFWLSAFALLEAGLCGIAAGTVLSEVGKLKQDPDVTTTLLKAQGMANNPQEALNNLQALLAGRVHEQSQDVNLAGSMLALKMGREQPFWDCAKAFWYRHLQAKGVRMPRPPHDTLQLRLFWAKELRKEGTILRAGFPFDASRHLPATAVECLMAVLHEEPQHLETLKLMETMTRDIRGLEQTRVGYLSILTLFERNDWRMGLELAIANLRAFRLDQGLEELAIARSLAQKQGQLVHFTRALKARDRMGQLQKILEKA